jgi:hypothetical protein
MAEYKGYFIFGKALKVYTDSLYWCSQGDVYTNEPAGSVLVARLEGVIFESEQAAKLTAWNSADNGSIKSQSKRRKRCKGMKVLQGLGEIEAADLRNLLIAVSLQHFH